MRIEPLDSAKRLWSVSDLLPADTVTQIQAFDWTSAEHEPGNLLNRRRIQINSEIKPFEKAITKLLPEINARLGTKFRVAYGSWWLDLPNFVCGMHTDGHLAYTMQMYWLCSGTQYGTGFYHYKNCNSLKYQFLSVPNTGYIMLNHLEPDGTQPLQWHGMFQPVAPGTSRLSSYHIFEL